MSLNNIAENQEGIFENASRRYGVLSNTLIELAGNVLDDTTTGPFLHSNTEFNKNAADTQFKERTVNTINSLLSSQPPELLSVIREMGANGCKFQMLGSYSRCGLLNDDELSNQNFQDIDFGIHNPELNATSYELLAQVHKYIHSVFDINPEDEYFSYVYNGRILWGGDINTAEPWLYTFKVNDTSYSFALTLGMDENGNIKIEPGKKRKDITLDKDTQYAANFRVPEALSNPLDLLIRSDEIVVDPNTQWSDLFLKTIVYGTNGQASQILGMPEELLDKSKEDPQFAIYLTKCLAMGNRYIWTPQLLKVIIDGYNEFANVFDWLPEKNLVQVRPSDAEPQHTDLLGLQIAGKILSAIPIEFLKNNKNGETIAQNVIDLLRKSINADDQTFHGFLDILNSNQNDIAIIKAALDDMFKQYGCYPLRNFVFDIPTEELYAIYNGNTPINVDRSSTVASAKATIGIFTLASVVIVGLIYDQFKSIGMPLAIASVLAANIFAFYYVNKQLLKYAHNGITKTPPTKLGNMFSSRVSTRVDLLELHSQGKDKSTTLN